MTTAIHQTLPRMRVRIVADDAKFHHRCQVQSICYMIYEFRI